MQYDLNSVQWVLNQAVHHLLVYGPGDGYYQVLKSRLAELLIGQAPMREEITVRGVKVQAYYNRLIQNVVLLALGADGQWHTAELLLAVPRDPVGTPLDLSAFSTAMDKAEALQFLCEVHETWKPLPPVPEGLLLAYQEDPKYTRGSRPELSIDW